MTCVDAFSARRRKQAEERLPPTARRHQRNGLWRSRESQAKSGRISSLQVPNLLSTVGFTSPADRRIQHCTGGEKVDSSLPSHDLCQFPPSESRNVDSQPARPKRWQDSADRDAGRWIAPTPGSRVRRGRETRRIAGPRVAAYSTVWSMRRCRVSRARIPRRSRSSTARTSDHTRPRAASPRPARRSAGSTGGGCPRGRRRRHTA